MIRRHVFRAGRDSSGMSDPRQFAVIDVFAVITLTALVCAMAAPLLRRIPAEKLDKLLVIVSLQLVVTAGAVLLAANLRERLLEKSGRRIGLAYCGEGRWRHGPLVKSAIYMFLLASAQLCVWLLFAAGAIGDVISTNYLLFELQLGGLLGYTFARYPWR